MGNLLAVTFRRVVQIVSLWRFVLSGSHLHPGEDL
jgi:hypothetical protein